MGRKKAKALAISFTIICMLLLLPYLIPDRAGEDAPDNPFPESRIALVDGIRLHYRVFEAAGTEAGQILLVHGMGGSTFSWRNNVQALTKAGYQVLAVDLPGFGYSSRAAGLDHSQRQRSRLLWKLLEMLGGTGDPWILMGHSMGGGTIAAMALDYPERAAALVLVDGALQDNNRVVVSFLLRFPPFGQWADVLLQHLISVDAMSNILESAYGRIPLPEEVEGYASPLLLRGTARTLVDMTRTSSNENPDELAQLNIPILYIRGEKDSWVPLESAEELKEILPAMEIKSIPGAAHCPMETHPEEFNRILLDSLVENR